MTWSRRKTLWVVAALVLVASAAAGAWWAWRSGGNSAAPVLPPDEDVVSVTATLNDGGPYPVTPAVPEFPVPRKYMGTVLAALRPATARDGAVLGEQKGVTLGVLKVTTRQGQTLTIPWYVFGKYKLCYAVDGVRCVRGGAYKPLCVDGEDEFYGDEATALSAIIYLIHEEQSTGKVPDKLQNAIEDLERSRGERPPREVRD
jgi:hypothetical protein